MPLFRFYHNLGNIFVGQKTETHPDCNTGHHLGSPGYPVWFCFQNNLSRTPAERIQILYLHNRHRHLYSGRAAGIIHGRQDRQNKTGGIPASQRHCSHRKPHSSLLLWVLVPLLAGPAVDEVQV